MISLRYHLISIVAVFLALGVGVLMGTTVVKQGVINQLTSQANNAVRTSSDLRNAVAQLQGQVRTQSRFIDAVEPAVLAGHLDGTQVVVLTAEGVDGAEVDGVRTALGDSGATVVAVLVATARLEASDATAQTDLATILGAGASTRPADLPREVAAELGVRLADGPTPGQSDLLAQLMTGRFVAVRGGTETAPAAIGGPAQSIVVLSGSSTAPSLVDPSSFFVPFAESVVAADPARPLVLAESTKAVTPFVRLVRADGKLHSHVVTVDDADTTPGQVAVVLGLETLKTAPGDGGDYGVKCGSCDLVPPVPG